MKDLTVDEKKVVAMALHTLIAIQPQDTREGIIKAVLCVGIRLEVIDELKECAQSWQDFIKKGGVES